MELKEGYNGITDPKEFYNKIISEETKEAINDSKKIKEISDEIVDENWENDLGVISTSKSSYEYRLSTPIFESDDKARKTNSNYTFIPDTPTIKVRYHKELCPELIEMEKINKGDFIDLRAAENVFMWQGDFKLISLGISIQLPPGYHAEVVPRSSTYKNFGIIMSNSIGIIDESYCGDNDIWKFPAIAMRDTEIKVNDRICQFRIVKNRDINIEVVDKLNNEDRGGIGSTGKN